MPLQKNNNKAEFQLIAADTEKTHILKNSWLATLVMAATYLSIYLSIYLSS